MNTRRPKRYGLAMLVVGMLVAALVPLGGVAAFASLSPAPNPAHVQSTLEGCKDPSVDLEQTDFVCADTDYTSGNLGKGWNELDLVPHRITMSLGNQSAATTRYAVAIVADNLEGLVAGYDAISVPTVNPDSDSSCTVDTAAGPAATLTPGIGGTDRSMYRLLFIEQDKGSTCIFDYHERLALGSHNYPGSSLHSNMMNQAFGTAGIGASDVSIPVNDIIPQSLSKTMNSSQNSTHTWSLTKSPTPVSLDFLNTCATTGTPLEMSYTVTLSWDKLAADPTGPINYVTNIYAKNPAHRSVEARVLTDDIRDGTTVLHTKGPGDWTEVPANNQDVLIATFTGTVPASTADLNNYAVAEYRDTDTGLDISQTTNASSSAVAGAGTTLNGSATIQDVSSMTGTGFAYAIAAPSSGSFSGYTAGTPTTGSVTWNSGTVSADGSVTFTKTVYLDAPSQLTGSVQNTATLNGSDGFSTSASAVANITSDAVVSLTINKSVAQPTSEAKTFTFDIRAQGSSTILDTKTINFAANATSQQSVTATGLDPGTYVVTERAFGNYPQQVSDPIVINLPSCSASVSFINSLAPASARVRKVTDPTGSEAGWSFRLDGPGIATGGETVTTTGTGYVSFLSDIDTDGGTYTITEVPTTAQDGNFDLTAVSGDFTRLTATRAAGTDLAAKQCSFTYDADADDGGLLSCTFTNTERGEIIVDKVTQPEGDAQSFAFTLTGGPSALNQNFNLTDAATPHSSGNVKPGTGYAADETVPAGWRELSATCDDGSPVTNINLAAGETVTCTFTNQKLATVLVNKTVDGQPLVSGQSFTFEVRRNASTTSAGTVVARDVANFANSGVADFDPPTFSQGANFVSPKYFLPGTYQLCETSLMPNWSTAITPGSIFVPDLADNSEADNSTRCVNFTLDAGEHEVFAVDNTPPPRGDARTIGFWKNWSGNCTGGKQANVLGQTLGSDGVVIGDLTITQSMACSHAVPILNKSELNGKKRASHPAYNMAAQLLAAKLNVKRDVPLCGAAVGAAANGQALLEAIHFVAVGAPTMTTAQKTAANTYAGILDDFNNNTLACSP